MKRGIKICLFSLVFMFIFAGRKNYGYERVYEQIGMDGFGFVLRFPLVRGKKPRRMKRTVLNKIMRWKRASIG